MAEKKFFYSDAGTLIGWIIFFIHYFYLLRIYLALILLFLESLL